MNKNRSLLSILLAFLLLFAQASSLAHTVTHSFEACQNQQEQQLPHEQTCDQCHAFAEFGSVLTGNFAFPVPLSRASDLRTCLLVQVELPQRQNHFDSRAPPAA